MRNAPVENHKTLSLPPGYLASWYLEVMKAKRKRSKNAGVGIDFKRAKLKVGKKLPKAQNATDTNFKAQSISLPGQSAFTDDRAGVAVSDRNLTLKVIWETIQSEIALIACIMHLYCISLLQTIFKSACLRNHCFPSCRTCLAKLAITVRKSARTLCRECQSSFRIIQRSSRAR